MGNLFLTRLLAGALFCAALALLTTRPTAQSTGAPDVKGCSDERFPPVIEAVTAVMKEERLPSIAIAVGQRGRITCEAAFGWADRGRTIPATTSTMYSLASISKPFTATALMSLVEKGRLDLDRPANDYLGTARLRAFEGEASDATLRRLLTHTAGLPLHYQFFYQGGPAVPSMDAAIARYGIIVYPPGERYFYANFGYGVLERVIERAVGRPFAEALDQTVLGPLRLSETTVSDGAGLQAPRAALRYGPGGEPVRPYTFDHVGASGVWSSARDLIRFGMFHLGHDGQGIPAVSRETRQVMQQEHARADAAGRSRGLGWGIVESVGGWRQVAHTGSMPGVSTILSLYPEADIAVVVLTNVNNSRAVARVERALASAALPATLPPAVARRATESGGAFAASAPARDPGVGPGSALGGRWSGWIDVSGEKRSVELDVRSDDDVRITIGKEAAASIEAVRMSGNWFSGRTSARIVGPDAAPVEARPEHRTTLTLALRGERLSGWATALSTADPTYGAVSFPMSVTRVRGTAGPGQRQRPSW